MLRQILASKEDKLTAVEIDTKRESQWPTVILTLLEQEKRMGPGYGNEELVDRVLCEET